MREIKFRAWSKLKKEWVKEVTLEDNFVGIDLQTYFNWHLMQYTGLKDKNGVGIYDGDIVKALIDSEYFNQEVAWIEDRELVGWNLKSDREYEVIGNIYETPELLITKEQQQ